LTNRRWHSSVLHVRRFRGADCDIGHYPVASEVRDRLPINKRETQKTDTKRFNPKKVEGKNTIRLKSQTGSEFWKT
jgi:hypothetical protein